MTARRWGGTLTRISKEITHTKNNKQELYGSCFFVLRWIYSPLISAGVQCSAAAIRSANCSLMLLSGRNPRS